MKQPVESFLAWVQSLGRSGAWLVVTLGVLAVCGLALWVVHTALTVGRP
jgi:hypothetical protein